eukprot:snap_masked-scaffold_72-processed-gene-0.34-mRNA-1 protein AED:1.00 eAED:1.00 QI:0/0/0/0/1/1/5/0/66
MYDGIWFQDSRKNESSKIKNQNKKYYCQGNYKTKKISKDYQGGFESNRILYDISIRAEKVSSLGLD